MRVFGIGLLMTGAAFGDVLADWNRIMRTTIANEPAQYQSRFAAITHLAIFEAVNAINKEYQPYLGMLTAEPGALPEAAVVAAAYQVLSNYFPGSATSLASERTRSLALIPEGPGKTAGLVVGQAAAAAILSRRAGDGSASPTSYTPPVGTGYWQPTPPAFAPAVFAHWGKVTPFGILRADQFRPGPPPALTGNEYRRSYNEVKAVGGSSSTSRPQDRADVARFAAATSPVQMWNDLAIQLSTAEGTPLAENARILALLNIAICDASIAVFEAKYLYHFWRPVTAIRAGDLDANARTEPDTTFASFVITPAYPSYPSGFGGLSNAGRYILERAYGDGGHSLTLSLAALPDVRLRYSRLRQITDDIADARVYGGIHFRFEQEEAEVLGRRVAQWVLRHNLRCAGSEGCEDYEDRR